MAEVVAMAKHNMIKGQLMPVGVRDDRLLYALETVPRERFLPHLSPSLAYADLPHHFSSTDLLVSPQALARLLQTVGVKADEKVLYLGGAGYGAALCGYLAREVIAILGSDDCVKKARKIYEDLEIYNVILMVSPWREGMTGFAPYDTIIIEGALYDLPHSLLTQVVSGGRIAWYRNQGNGLPALATITEINQGLASHFTPFETSVPGLPGDEPEKRRFHL